MAFVYADRVRETTQTTGTGTMSLQGAPAQFQPFSVVGNGNTCDYCVLSGNGTDWETGNGTYTLSGATLSRDSVYASSVGGSLISLTGISTVFLTPSAKKIPRVRTLTASSSATLDFTGLDTTGNRYRVVGKDLLPATNAVIAELIIGTGSIPTYQSSSYEWSLAMINSNATASTGNTEAGSYWQVGSTNISSTGTGVSFDFMFTGSSLWGVVKNKNNDGHWYASYFQGEWTGGSSGTALRFQFSSGNVTSGKIAIEETSWIT
jgi:hypothetical protein